MERHEILTYLRQIETVVNQWEEDGNGVVGDDEERELFLNNVLDEIMPNLYRWACDMKGSRVIEKVAAKGTLQQCCTLLEALQPQFSDALSHLYSSHVLQTLVERMALVTSKSPDVARVGKNMSALMDVMVDSLNLVVTDTYGSHVLRSFILVTSGVLLTDDSYTSSSGQSFNRGKGINRKKGRRQQQQLQAQKARPVPPVFAACRKTVLESLKACPELSTWITHDVAGPVLQAALDAVCVSEGKAASTLLSAALLGKFIAEQPEETGSGEKKASKLSILLYDKRASHLIERIVETSQPQLLHQMYVTAIRGSAPSFACHGVSNYIIQKLLRFMAKDDCMLLVKELIDSVENIYAENRSSVVVEMARASARHAILQRPLFLALRAAFHIDDASERETLLLLLMQTTLDFYQQQVEELAEKTAAKKSDASKASSTSHAAANTALLPIHCTATGSQLVQALLDFDVPEAASSLTAGFVRLGTDQLVTLCTTTQGSFVVQKFFSTPHVELKHKARVINALAESPGAVFDIATHPAGSHVFDTMWRKVELKQRETIAQALLENEERLYASKYGRIVARNVRLDHFKRRKQEWAAKVQANERKKDMFADIIGDPYAVVIREKDADAKKGGQEGVSSGSKKHKRRHESSDRRSSQAAPDEIDLLFQGKSLPLADTFDTEEGLQPKKKTKEKDLGIEEHGDASATAKKKKKKRKKEFKDISFVADAIQATKKGGGKGKKGKKGKKAKLDGSDSEEQDPSRKKAKKKKKKKSKQES